MINPSEYSQHLSQQLNMQLMGDKVGELKNTLSHSQERQKLKEASQQLEAVFLKQLLDAMDKTVDRENGILNGGHAEETFRGLLNQHIAVSMATRRGGSGLGFAESIYKQMSEVMDAKKLAEPGEGGAVDSTQSINVEG